MKDNVYLCKGCHYPQPDGLAHDWNVANRTHDNDECPVVDLLANLAEAHDHLSRALGFMEGILTSKLYDNKGEWQHHDATKTQMLILKDIVSAVGKEKLYWLKAYKHLYRRDTTEERLQELQDVTTAARKPIAKIAKKS